MADILAIAPTAPPDALAPISSISPGDTMISVNPTTSGPSAFPQAINSHGGELPRAIHRHSSIPSIPGLVDPNPVIAVTVPNSDSLSFGMLLK